MSPEQRQEIAARLETLRPSDEVGTLEIAVCLGLSRAYVTAELVKRADFPKPSTNVSNKTRRWRWGQVQRFKRGGQ